MIKTGVLKQIRIIDVLQRIEMHMQNGLLVANADGQEIELYFQRGLLQSIGHKKHIPLGERLVQAGVIANDHLREAKLTRGITENQALTSGDHGELLIALTLIQLQRLSREQLNVWLTQEAIKLLQDLLTGPECEVYFDEGIQTPLDRFPLNYRVTSLIAALGASTSRLSLTEPASAIEELPLSIPVTPLPSIPVTPLSKKARLVIPNIADPVTPLPTLARPLSSGVRKTRLFSLDGTTIGKLATIRMKILKRDPHPEQLATLSTVALKGITQPKHMNNSRIRVTGILFVMLALFYIFWIVGNLNKDALWFSLLFLSANIFISISIFVSIFNNWSRSTPHLFKIPTGLEPVVAVLIPTYGEPVEMLQNTIESVLQQYYPKDSLVIVVGDDGHRDVVQSMVENMQKNHVSAQIVYHQPPSKDNPERVGGAKDGNLNSMLKFIEENYSHIQYIETRDADDIVGDANFLRYTIGHLVSNPKASYVQTIKEAMVSPGDPFGNLQPMFYRGIMLSKHAANAVFPCGSGLVWRKRHLSKIGGFPTWNLVEDLYSGYVALQHGLKGSYLSILGAVGQTAPEDIPNVYKQLGTWALDTVRLFIWKNPWFVKGLTFKQKMHFTEMGLYYLSSFAQLVFLLTPVICLFTGIVPFASGNGLIFMFFLITYMLIIDLLVVFLGYKVTFQEIWRAKQLNTGMMFVYMKASFLAIMYGARKKPAYKVTRKVQMVGFYFKEVFFQALVFVFLLSSVIYNIWLHHDMLQNIDFGSAIWALLYMAILSGMISKSWYGVKLT